MSTRPRLLFLAAFLPSPVSAQAGQKTAFRHLTWLAERYDIWFVGFRNEVDRPGDEQRLRDLCREVTLFPLSWTRRIAGALLRPGVPLLVAARWRPAFARAVRTLVARHDFARVHCEWSQMAEYLPEAMEVPERWISAHDVVFQFCARATPAIGGLRRWWGLWETHRARQWELTRGLLATTLLVQSPKDADLIRSELPALSGRLRLVPPFFERHKARLRTVEPAGPVLLFWGALARPENAEAALWLARELMPVLGHRLPEARLLLGGSNPPPAVLACSSKSIRVTGFVAEPQSLFDEAHVAVLPLFRGAGIKVKVLECLAAGLPVLTSAIGAEGIDAGEVDGLVVAEPVAVAYARWLEEWWRAPAAFERLSRGAMAWADRLGEADRQVLFGP